MSPLQQQPPATPCASPKTRLVQSPRKRRQSSIPGLPEEQHSPKDKDDREEPDARGQLSGRCFSPSPVILCFCSQTPFQRTSPPRIAQRVGGVSWHDLGTVIVDVHPRRGAACTSERVAMTRIATSKRMAMTCSSQRLHHDIVCLPRARGQFGVFFNPGPEVNLLVFFYPGPRSISDPVCEKVASLQR